MPRKRRLQPAPLAAKRNLNAIASCGGLRLRGPKMLKIRALAQLAGRCERILKAGTVAPLQAA
jgi:hypothetical protein